MNNTKNINYPGIIRAFNKIEEKQELENKFEILSLISSLIDEAIQKDLECVRVQHETISMAISISEDEIRKLLKELEESNITLYESISNEQALFFKKCYHVSSRDKLRHNTKKNRTSVGVSE